MIYLHSLDFTVPALEARLSEIRSLFETNLFAVIRLRQTFMPLLRRSHGTIVQIGSVAGTFPYAWGSVYNASKAALHSFSASLRIEVAPLGVHVITVVTGGVKSRIARDKRSLSKDSLYRSIDDDYQKRQVHSQEVGMSAEAYAKEVVGKVLAAEGYFWRTRTIWAGGAARTAYGISWLSEIVTEWACSRMFGFEKLRRLQADGAKAHQS